MSLLRLLGEPHSEATEVARIASRAGFPLDARWYRRYWRWRSRAVVLALVVGLVGGYALAWRADEPVVSIPPVPVPRPPSSSSAGWTPSPEPTSTPSPSPSPPPSPSSAPPPPTPDPGPWQRDPEVSWYGPGFYGHRTACGLALTTSLIGVAHRSLPCGTIVEFRWRGVVVRAPVVDRGPYVAGRQWDLTGGACLALDHCFTGPIEWRFP